MTRRLVVVVAASLAFALGCSSKNSDSENVAGNGGSSGAGAGAGMAGSTAAIGGTGGSGTSGTGNASAGKGGASAGKGGASTGGGGTSAGASQAGNAQAGGSTEGVGYDCAYTDLSSKLNGLADDTCLTGYCLWDGRYFGESYCTIACSGAGGTCPDGYTCSQDLEASSKYWCAQNAPTAPTDLGAMCSSQYLSDCTGSQPRESFCGAPAVDSCQNGYCVYDGVTKSAYCSTPCRDTTAPCPEGYDCWKNPSGITGVNNACVQHHEPAELVGLHCYHGTPYKCDAGMPCATTEEATVPSCAPQGGYCIYDQRMGVTEREYCTMKCDTATCPDGYTCTSLPYGVDPISLCVVDL